MVPAGKVVATLPQRAEPSNRSNKCGRPAARVSGSIEDRRPDSAGTDMRADGGTDEVDRDSVAIEPPRLRDDEVAECFDVGAHRVEDRQSLDRSLADELDEPLTRLRPG